MDKKAKHAVRGRVYLAGPMRGISRYNFEAFDHTKERLEAQGWEVVSPADLDRARGLDPDKLPAGHDYSKEPAGFSYADVMEADLQALGGCTAIFMLSGFSRSAGALQELGEAMRLHHTVLFENGMEFGPMQVKAAYEAQLNAGNELVL